jgi:mono/diheme cytochrome c family protein
MKTDRRTILFLFFAATQITVWAQTKKTTIDKASLDRGKIVYETYCLACHQADGSGVPNLNPPLIKTEWTTGDKKKLITVVLKGMDEEIEVDGESYHNVMPPLAHLSDREIADVLTYVRSNFSNNASAVTVNEVNAVRTKL